MAARLRTALTADPVGRCGHYELLGRLARGGMAEIYLACDTASPSDGVVAIKRILPHVSDDPRFIAMFEHEAGLAQRLSHPNICAIHEHGHDRGIHYLVMEWVKGVPLERIIQRSASRGGIPFPIVVKIAHDVASALDHAHRVCDEDGHPLGIVHRDVTPENVVVRVDGCVKLLDFGIAKAVTQRHKTNANELKGKLAYMSPEQYARSQLDGRADVFALGVCMYEALTGEPLYHRASEFETIAAIMLDPRVPSVRQVKPALPRRLDAIVAKALAKPLNDRYQSAAELCADIGDFLADERLVVREAGIAEYLEDLIGPELHEDPALDTTPLGGSAEDVRSNTGTRDAEPDRRSVPHTAVRQTPLPPPLVPDTPPTAAARAVVTDPDQAALLADVDVAADEIVRARRAKATTVLFVVVTIVAVAIAALAIALRGGL